jgi:hypothetical protein
LREKSKNDYSIDAAAGSAFLTEAQPAISVVSNITLKLPVHPDRLAYLY